MLDFSLRLAPLVDTSENHSGSAMLMLLSVVVVGLAVFLIYKFKRYWYPFQKPDSKLDFDLHVSENATTELREKQTNLK